jgi:hypothetical protein
MHGDHGMSAKAIAQTHAHVWTKRIFTGEIVV